MANPYDQFDTPAADANPYDQFDEAGNLRLQHPNLAGYGTPPAANSSDFAKLITGEKITGAPNLKNMVDAAFRQANQGYKVADFSAQPGDTDPSLSGTAAALGSGAVQGVGQLNWLERYPEYLIRQGLSHLGVQDRLAAAQGNSGEGVMTAGFHDPQNTTERVANVAGNFAGSLPIYAATEGLAAPVILSGTIGASEAGAKGGSAGDIARSGIISAAAPAAGYGVGKLIGKVITPHTAIPEHQALVDILDQAGIPMTAGQRTGSKPLRYLEDTLGPHIDKNPDLGLVKAYTEHVMSAAGEPAGTTATQPEVARMFGRIGGDFDRVYGRNNMIVDQQAQNEARQAFADYAADQPNDSMIPRFKTIVDSITGAQPGAVVNGPSYGITRSVLAKMQRGNSSSAADGTNKDMAGTLKDIIDGAMERSISSGPHAAEDLGALQSARKQYRIALEVERSATGGSNDANYGLLTPLSMQQAVKTVEGRRAYATGQGPLSEVTNAAAGVGRPLPQSGTAPRREFLERLGLAGVLGGAGAYEGKTNEEMNNQFGAWGPTIGGIGGAAGGWLVPSMAGHLLLNSLTQRILGNQVLSPKVQAILKALGASGGAAVTPEVKPKAEHVIKVLTGSQ